MDRASPIDLNPVAAGIVQAPEASPHTSITTRVEHVNTRARPRQLAANPVARTRQTSPEVLRDRAPERRIPFPISSAL